jgi:flagellar biosynthesis protein FlhB
MSDKQFPPSIKRLNKARREGKIVKSRMVSSAVCWWAAVLAIIPTVAWVRNGTLVQWLDYKVWTPQVAFYQAGLLGLKISCVLVGAVAVCSLGAGLAQTRGLFLPSQLARGFEQYRPGAFIGRVKQSLIDSALGLVRCCVIAAFLIPIFTELVTVTPSNFEGTMGAALATFERVVRAVCVRGGTALILIAAVAYALARWRFFQQQKMTLQEVKDEYKEDEGDPHTKAHRKHEHRALLFSEIEKRVKRSKVVVVRRAKGGGGQ